MINLVKKKNILKITGGELTLEHPESLTKKLDEMRMKLINYNKEKSKIDNTELMDTLKQFQDVSKLIDQVKKRNCKTAKLVDFQGFNLKIAKKLNRRA